MIFFTSKVTNNGTMFVGILRDGNADLLAHERVSTVRRNDERSGKASQIRFNNRRMLIDRNRFKQGCLTLNQLGKGGG